jgi:DNA (cytosine-5)-methyltransferase 1
METTMRVLDLFSGIGGFSLGLERAGMRTVAFCEIDPYCRRVLAKHWPDVPIYGDIRELTAARLMADARQREPQECAGFDGEYEQRAAQWRRAEQSAGPGAGGGTGDGRSAERIAVGGSVAPAHTGIDVICGGFPCQGISVAGKGAGLEDERSGLWSEYARIIGEVRPRYVIVENVAALLGRGLERVLGDLAALGFDAEWHCIPASAVGAPHRRDRIWIVANANGARLSQRQEYQLLVQCETAVRSDWWLSEPDVGRVAHGIPARVDRLRSLGNAVVPQIPEIIGRAIMHDPR